MSACRVLADLDELISQAEAEQDYCSETGPNEAMKRAASLKEIRAETAELVRAIRDERSKDRSYRDWTDEGDGPRISANVVKAAVRRTDAALARFVGHAAGPVPARDGEILTYDSQPDNLGASRLGEACRKAADEPRCGDYIDRGLILLRELQAKGYGIAPLGHVRGFGR
jgi:hypothetical protein